MVSSGLSPLSRLLFFFFFNDTATTEIYTLSLHDALPISAWKIDPDPSGTGQDYNPFINNIYGFEEWGTIGEDWSGGVDRKSTRLNSSHSQISYAVFCLKKKNTHDPHASSPLHRVLQPPTF